MIHWLFAPPYFQVDGKSYCYCIPSSVGKSSKTKATNSGSSSRLKAFDKELTDTSKKALKTFRQRLASFRLIAWLLEGSESSCLRLVGFNENLNGNQWWSRQKRCEIDCSLVGVTQYIHWLIYSFIHPFISDFSQYGCFQRMLTYIYCHYLQKYFLLYYSVQHPMRQRNLRKIQEDLNPRKGMPILEFVLQVSCNRFESFLDRS